MPRPFIPLHGGAKAILTINQSGTNYVFNNILHFHTAGGFYPNTLQLLAETLGAWDYSRYADLRHTTFYLVSIQTVALDIPDDQQYFINYGATRPGTASGTVRNFALTKSCALRTARRGRGQQGRAFLPPLPDSLMYAGATLAAGVGQTIADIFQQLIIDCNNTDPPMPLVVASYRFNHIWRTDATWEPVVEAVVHNSRIDTLRRRLRQVTG